MYERVKWKFLALRGSSLLCSRPYNGLLWFQVQCTQSKVCDHWRGFRRMNVSYFKEFVLFSKIFLLNSSQPIIYTARKLNIVFRNLKMLIAMIRTLLRDENSKAFNSAKGAFGGGSSSVVVTLMLTFCSV